MKLSKLFPYLLHQFKSETDLIKAIEELSINFTQKREKINDYLKDERLSSAYTAFYLTTNMPKLQAVFKWMPAEWLEQIKDCTFVDVGAGPGTFSLAFRDWVGHPVKVMQVEKSKVMQKQADRIWEGLYPEEKLLNYATGEKLLFFGHSANEMGSDEALKYVREFNPEHILFVEPGTKDFFPTMIQIRESLIKQGYNILFPCPTSGDCPLRNSDQDWCHQFIHVQQDSEVERLSQIAKKDRRNLPLIVHAFSRTFSIDNPSSRIVRVLAETKFSYEWEVCELNHLQHYQIMKRGMSKMTTQVLSEALAGDAVFVELDKQLEKSKRMTIIRLNNTSLKP